MASKTVLVHCGVHKKVVNFSGDLDCLKEAILVKFSLEISPQRLLIQWKSEEWSGEWIDGDEIEDKAVVKAMIPEVL